MTNPRGKPCRHGNRPAERCRQCQREAGGADPTAAGIQPADGTAAALATVQDEAVRLDEQRRAAVSGSALALLEAHARGQPLVPVGDAMLAAAVAEAWAGPPGRTPHGGGSRAGAQRVVAPPLTQHDASPTVVEVPEGKLALAKELAEAGLLSDAVASLADEPEDEVDEEPPDEAQLPPEESPREAAAGPKWGAQLPNKVRLSPDYRLALYRVGEDYYLAEMVLEREEAPDGETWVKQWRERTVYGPEGYDVVMGRLLDMAVEVMSP